MKKVFLGFGMLTLFAFAALAASAVAPASFAGTWKLDKEKSKGLNPNQQSAESIVWTITQDDKQITIDSKVTPGQPPAGAAPAGAPAGGPGGGGGRGGGMGGPRTYTLDGKEVTSEGGGQMGGTNTMKSSWSNEGKTLELSSVRTGSVNGNDFKAVSTDKLSLSADGKVLTVERHSESPRGAQDATLVFNKQ
ncbi:MAG: hypothetical protein QOE77_2853 [Blastocatellia bacterium]|jgi:hypothetical protein|nr:hypothetical protein [Blastocatellia bacterium]